VPPTGVELLLPHSGVILAVSTSSIVTGM